MLASTLLFSQNDSILYSFFVAGHTYGNPSYPQYGLYPPFVNKIEFINDNQDMEFGCLTGDVVVSPTAEYWDSAQVDMDKFDIPLYIAAGNHDIGVEFTQRFGDYYYSFVLHDDLFITLTPSLNNWNISGYQKDFLFETLSNQAQDVNNIFIFLHELIWWSPDSIFQNVIINYVPGYPGSTNFWSEIEPVISALPNNIVFFAGDLGCTSAVTPFMYYKYDNITLIGSGMGGGIEDNFVIIDVYNDSIDFNLIALNGEDINALGELTDFILSINVKEQIDHQVTIYPNPVKSNLFIDCSLPSESSFQILDMNGRLIFNEFIRANEIKKINTNKFSRGHYMIRILNNNSSISKKVLKL